MVDPITLELIAEGLTSIVREMRAIVIRTAYSAMIHEGHDFSCAILTAGGDLLAASEVDQPTHLSALPWSARTILAKYAHDMREGDLFVHNDPYTGGTHLNDVVLIHPMFQDNRPEHDPEKWEPVFGKRSCSNKEEERDDDPHPSLPRLRGREGWGPALAKKSALWSTR